MKHRIFCLTALLLALCLLCACAKAPSNASSAAPAEDSSAASASAPAETAPAEDPVVATVNGTDILYSEFAAQMVNIESMYSAMSATLSADEINRKLTEQASGVLETLINQVLLEQKAEQLGITLTAAQEAEVSAAWDGVKARFQQTIAANYPTFTGEDLDAMVLLALESSGLTEEMVTESARTSALIAGLRSRVDADIPDASDADARALYDTLLAEQRTEFADNPSTFESAMLGNTVVVYIPAAYRVLHEWDVRYDNEVIALLNQLEEIDTDESTAYEDTLAAEQTRAQEQLAAIRAQLAAGADFDTLYAAANDGASPRINYLCETTDRFSPDYFSAAMSIPAEGGVADDAVALKYGYTLLYWADTLQPGVVPFETVKEELTAQFTQQARDENWKTVQAAWRAAADVSIDKALITYS
mgnify:CR=1 FL=1